MKIAFVGCGAVGRALARLWLNAGHEIGAVHARTHAAEAVATIGAGVADGPLDDADGERQHDIGRQGGDPPRAAADAHPEGIGQGNNGGADGGAENKSRRRRQPESGFERT